MLTVDSELDDSLSEELDSQFASKDAVKLHSSDSALSDDPEADTVLSYEPSKAHSSELLSVDAS